MNNKIQWVMCGVLMTVSCCHAYLIQGVDLTIDQWVGTGSSECVVAIDWNGTAGPYETEFHLFGYRWDGDKTVADALVEIDAAVTALQITTAYGGAFLDDIIYAQTAVDGDYHTAGDYKGWWWLGETQDGGQTWTGNAGGFDAEYLWDGGIEGLNVDGGNWGSANMTIPEPATMALLAAGLLMARKRK